MKQKEIELKIAEIFGLKALKQCLKRRDIDEEIKAYFHKCISKGVYKLVYIVDEYLYILTVDITSTRVVVNAYFDEYEEIYDIEEKGVENE